MKTEKKKTLRGSALFTVVAVMAILILFLTGTLALATASNSRAHKSYAVSQASYTARSAISAFKKGMEQDADLAATVGAIGEGSLTKFEPQIKISDKTMGKIGYWDYSDADHPIWVDDCIKLEPVADKVDWVYDTAKNEWVSWNIVRVTSTCRVGQEEETVVAYISKHGEPGQQKIERKERKRPACQRDQIQRRSDRGDQQKMTEIPLIAGDFQCKIQDPCIDRDQQNPQQKCREDPHDGFLSGSGEGKGITSRIWRPARGLPHSIATRYGRSASWHCRAPRPGRTRCVRPGTRR